ncbi:MAG: hypothetical protein ACK5AZ_19765 [Bryobacteraceae bacterium]
MRSTSSSPERLGLIAIAFALGPTAAFGQAPCTVNDASSEVMSDCSFITWQGRVHYSFVEQPGTYAVGWFQGANECDPGGLNCDGSWRPYKMYKATKLFNSWPNYYQPDMAQFWWNVNNQYLHWESCLTPTGESANTVTNYSFTMSTGWYQIWCD